MKIQNGKKDAKQSKLFRCVFYLFIFFLNFAYFISVDIHVCIPNFAKLMAGTGITLYIHIVVHVLF